MIRSQTPKIVTAIMRKPTYVWRPDHIVRRIARTTQKTPDPLVKLPWGAHLRVDRRDFMAAGIVRASVHEPAVTEAMWRLTTKTDLALDVGANIGYFTSLLACRARKVIAFEPHPRTVARLRMNVERWPFASVDIQHCAASDVTGTAHLIEPPGFDAHSGIAHVLTESGAGATSVYEVATVRLDEVVENEFVGVLKVDVEGHEGAVLDGLQRALSDGRVRDVLFEALEPLPTAASECLTAHGYSIFSLYERFRGVELRAWHAPSSGWYAPMYLATIDAKRATALVQANGWHCLRPRRRPS